MGYHSNPDGGCPIVRSWNSVMSQWFTQDGGYLTAPHLIQAWRAAPMLRRIKQVCIAWVPARLRFPASPPLLSCRMWPKLCSFSDRPCNFSARPWCFSCFSCASVGCWSPTAPMAVWDAMAATTSLTSLPRLGCDGFLMNDKNRCWHNSSGISSSIYVVMNNLNPS